MIIMENIYEEMVRRLLKRTDFHNEYSGLVHATIGLGSELNELQTALINGDNENLLEELGDIMFYMQGISNEVSKLHTLGLTTEKVTVAKEMSDDWLANEDMWGLFSASTVTQSLIEDAVKKAWVYGKVLDYKEVCQRLAEMYFIISIIMKRRGLSPNEAREHNMDKLANKDTARFKNGYSDEAARARADKQ